MARPHAPAQGEQASTAIEGEREAAAAMLPKPAADKEDTFGTKTLAQLRQEAIQQRKDALEAIMPERAALLRELFFLLTDKQDPARFGAGLDPTGSLPDTAQEAALQEKIAAFTERWIREPRVASQIPTELPPLKPTPPASPMRRDSTIIDMSEEVAAVERELIKPEYRKQAPPPLSTTGVAARNGLNGADGDMNVDGDGNFSPNREGATSHRRQHSLVSPFPITFHSPGFSASTPPIKQEDAPFPLVLQPISTQEPSSASGLGSGSMPDTAAMNNAQAGPSKLTSPRKPLSTVDTSPLRAYPVPYPPSLPTLPDYMIKNRVNVGGLNRKKTRDRFAIQQNPQLAGTLATSADLYKLGVSRALHSSVRSLVGAGAPPPEKSRTGGKVLSTSDWQVVISEMQSQRAMERIEQLKAERTWSMRQYRKQRPPATHKAHWDYLLDEMRWMAVDFKQETRWKIASAYEIARAVEDYHNASSEEERRSLQIPVREPKFLTGTGPGDDVVEGEEDTQMDAVVPESQDDGNTSLTQAAGEKASKLDEKHSNTKKSRTGTDGSAHTPSTAGNLSLPTPTGAPEVRPKKYQHQLIKARAPVFDLSLNATVFDLSKTGLPDAYVDVNNYDLANELFQELAPYGPPAEPSNDTRQNRRIDESNPTYARISNPAYMLESKPLLVSTLQPSRKRKVSGEWGDLTELLAEDGKDPLSDIYGAIAENAPPPPNMKVKDTGNKRFTPVAPANAEQRLALLEWTPEEDRLLYNYARLYGYNWDLIASIFNSATHRLKNDERLAWDCYDRWHKRYAPLPTPASAGPSSSTPAQPSAPLPASTATGGPQSPGQMQQQQTDAQTNIKKDKRAPSASLAPPAAAAVPVVKKPELSKAQIRHMSIMDATKKAQKKREIQQKNNVQPAIRKINLNAHESHNQPMHPGLTALDLSRLKAERERQHMEEMRKREQAKLYQQAQAAAMAQTQMQAQQQGGQPRGSMPPNMQGSPMQGPQMPQLPPGAMPPNMQGSQPLPIMQGQPQQQQRIPMGQMPQQMPPGMQMQGPMPQQHQQGQPRPMPQGGQQVQRPPSQAGQQQQGPGSGQQGVPMPQQQPMMNGQGPMMVGMPANSPPMQPNMQPMHMPIQPMPQQINGSPSTHSQSPQSSQMQQLSPHQVQMQLQQHQAGNPQMSPAQQQALLAQLSQMRAGSPAMQPGQMPGGFPMQMPQHMSPEQQQQQQQLMALMRMRQNSQASSQGSVQ